MLFSVVIASLVAALASAGNFGDDFMQALRGQSVLQPQSEADRFMSTMANPLPMFTADVTKAPSSGGFGFWRSRTLTVSVIPTDASHEDDPGQVHIQWKGKDDYGLMRGAHPRDITPPGKGHQAWLCMCHVIELHHPSRLVLAHGRVKYLHIFRNKYAGACPGTECNGKDNCFCIPMKYEKKGQTTDGVLAVKTSTAPAATKLQNQLNSLYQLVAVGNRLDRWQAAALGTGHAGASYTCLFEVWSGVAMMDDAWSAYVTSNIMGGNIAKDSPLFDGFRRVDPRNRCSVGVPKMGDVLKNNNANTYTQLTAEGKRAVCKLWYIYYVHEKAAKGGIGVKVDVSDVPDPEVKEWCPGNLQEGLYGKKIPSQITADEFCGSDQLDNYIARAMRGSAEEYSQARFSGTSMQPLSTLRGKPEDPFTMCF